MNKKAMNAEILVAIALGIIIIGAMAYITSEFKGETEKSIFQKFWEMIFPKRTETVVIPGTAVGGACSQYDVKNVVEIAVKIVECWNENGGDKGKIDNNCCSMLRPSDSFSGITDSHFITENDLEFTLEALPEAKGVNIDWDLPDKISGPAPAFTVCYDTDAMGSGGEIFLTYNPIKQCS